MKKRKPKKKYYQRKTPTPPIEVASSGLFPTHRDILKHAPSGAFIVTRDKKTGKVQIWDIDGDNNKHRLKWAFDNILKEDNNGQSETMG